MKVGDVMTKRPAVVGLDTPVREAAELMRSPALAEQVGWEPQRVKAPRVRDVMTWSVVILTERDVFTGLRAGHEVDEAMNPFLW